MKYKYFSYCPEDGFDTHETLEDALLNANGIIPNYLDEGWSEDVTGVFVGTITHAATMCDKVERAGEVDEHGYDEDGEHWPDPDWEYKCNYKMLPVEHAREGVSSLEISPDGSAVINVCNKSLVLTAVEFSSVREIFKRSAFFDIKRGTFYPWIPVTESLPEKGVSVLVYSPTPEDGYVAIDCIDEDCDSGERWYAHSEGYDHYCSVAKGDFPHTGPSEQAPYTHWMPYPDVPEVKL